MKALENIKLETADGKPYIDAVTEKQIDTVACIKATLNNCEYKTREDQRNADKVYEKVDAVAEDAVTFDLEDADYELVKKYVTSYPPFLSGRIFSKVLAQFEE